MKTTVWSSLFLVCTFVISAHSIYEAACTFDGYLYPDNTAAPDTSGTILLTANGVCIIRITIYEFVRIL